MTNKDYQRLTDTGITTTPEEICSRLHELEDKIENRELIFIPKLGTPFWYLERDWHRGNYYWRIRESVVSDVLWNEWGIFIATDFHDEPEGFLPPERVYLSLEAANKALKKKQKWEEEHNGE